MPRGGPRALAQPGGQRIGHFGPILARFFGCQQNIGKGFADAVVFLADSSKDESCAWRGVGPVPANADRHLPAGAVPDACKIGVMWCPEATSSSYSFRPELLDPIQKSVGVDARWRREFQRPHARLRRRAVGSRKTWIDTA